MRVVGNAAVKTPEGQIPAAQVSQVAGMVRAGLVAGIARVRDPETELDKNARELREKVYAGAGKSFDALMELAALEKTPTRTSMKAYGDVVKLAHRDMIEVAKLQLERERMVLEAETARLDREAKERAAKLEAAGGRTAPIVIVDAETIARAKDAAREQERLRGAGE